MYSNFFFLILSAVLAVNCNDQPDVEMHSESVDGTKMVLACRAKSFNTSEIELLIKKNRCDLLTKEDGVRSSGVHQHTDNTYWRRDYIIVSKSEMSKYSCEVIHAESRFHVEKVWDPESDGGGRSISSPPHVVVSVDDKEQANITLTCQAKDFYPRDITVNIKRNGIILTREDGVKTSLDVCPSEDNTFQRTDSIISKSDVSKYSCEVVHVASGYHEEKVWDGTEDKAGHTGDKSAITAAIVAPVLVLVVLVVLNRKHIFGAAARQMTAKYTVNCTPPPVNSTPPPVGNAAPPPESNETRGSQGSLTDCPDFANSASDESGFDASDKDDTSNKAETENLLKINVAEL